MGGTPLLLLLLPSSIFAFEYVVPGFAAADEEGGGAAVLTPPLAIPLLLPLFVYAVGFVPEVAIGTEEEGGGGEVVDSETTTLGLESFEWEEPSSNCKRSICFTIDNVSELIVSSGGR